MSDINSIYNKSAAELTEADKKNILSIIENLNFGKIRVAEAYGDHWKVNEDIKKAILVYFRIQKNQTMEVGMFSYFDKIEIKKWTEADGVRVVPPATVRYGAFIEPGAVLMPSYVNIGAYVGSGTMVDTWATVGSCAQIGKNVHLSGGVGIGGVLEPVQAQPVIVEDNCFVGSRAILVEGVRVCAGAVIGAGVTITGSTKIIDITDTTEKVYTGFVPPNSVVIPGVYNKKFAAGEYGVPCALIIGQRKASTDLKTSLNSALRDFGVPV